MDEHYGMMDEKYRKSALETQVGGSHYKDFRIQPIQFSFLNGLDFFKGTVVKRIMRFDQPTGKGAEDLRKIQHEIDLYIEIMEMEE